MIKHEKPDIIDKTMDRMIVNDDFVVASGYDNGPNFNELTKINGRDIYFPAFAIWKVHKGHPIKIERPGNYPYVNVNYVRKGVDTRMPAKIHNDKESYDLGFFLLMPMAFDIESESAWKRICTIKDAFVTPSGKKPVMLVYADHGYSFKEAKIAAHLTPTQIPDYFANNFLSQQHKIQSHERTFKRKDEGIIQISKLEATSISGIVASLLEKRYDTQMKYWEFDRLETSTR